MGWLLFLAARVGREGAATFEHHEATPGHFSLTLLNRDQNTPLGARGRGARRSGWCSRSFHLSAE